MNRISLLFLLIIAPSMTMAATYYVHPDSTYSTIQSGINAASAGDSVVVLPGTYYESIFLADSITVRSTGGSSQTIVVGGDSTRTVYADGTNDMNFGGTNAGFTVRQGSSYGMIFEDCARLEAEDIVVRPLGSYQSIAGIRFYNCANTVSMKAANISYQDSMGIDVWYSDVSLEDIDVEHVDYRGIRIDFWSEPALEDIDVSDCETGLFIGWADVIVDDMTFDECETAIIVDVPYAVSIDLTDISIEDCDDGIITDGSNNLIDLNIDNLDCSQCTTGLVLDDTKLCLTNSSIYYIYGTGIEAGYCSDTLIIGESGSTNSFYDIDGDAIYLGANCKAVVRSSFESVSGTAINCNTGTDNVDIVYSDFDGSGCFEGISTSGSGTLATVRNCDLYNYQAHTSPSPRAAIAYKATADYGTVSDNGDNDFHDNSTDLNYANRDASPDSLYAVKNWWGENPPDASSFAGRTGYIVYQPYRTTAPRLIPTDAVPAPAPEILAIRNTFPNPTSDHVTIRCQIPDRADAELLIWDVSGRIVRRIDIHPGDSEMVEISWDGTDGSDNHLPSGTYFCRLKSTLDSNTRRIVLTR